MNSLLTPNGSTLNTDKILEYEEYYLIKENNGYKFIIAKTEKEIIIRSKNYENKFNNNDLSILTKAILDSIDDAYLYIINLFEQNKVNLKEIKINKSMTIMINIYIYNQLKDIEINLLYNKMNKNKDLIINELNDNYNKYKNEINSLNSEINKLKKEINELKKLANNYNINNGTATYQGNEISNLKDESLNLKISIPNEKKIFLIMIKIKMC